MNKKTSKTRLDILLTEKNLFESRQKAQSAIMAGLVIVNNEKIDKAGTQISNDAIIEIKGNTCPYVSRGGLKLDKALKEFNLNIKDKICIDAGASTGGFTDCLLQNGAKFIYAVDVGYGQLDWKLRNNPNIKVIERCNIRNLEPTTLYPTEESPIASLCTMDLSFISATKVLSNIINLLDVNKEIIILIKPQFEAGKEAVPKSGVVKDKKIHFEVISSIIDFCHKLKLYPQKLTYSPVKGPSGNIEYLTYITNTPSDMKLDIAYISDLIDIAHQELD